MAAHDKRRRRRANGSPTLATFLASRLADTRRILVESRPALLDGDVAAVHAARVATRRLRGDLRTHRARLDAATVAGLDGELRDLARTLGAVRDLDVLIPRLEALTAELPEADRRAGRALVGHAIAQRGEALAALHARLSSPAHDALLARLEFAAAAPPVSGHRATDAVKAVRKALDREHRANAARAKRIGRNPDPAELHALRKKVKRTRYAAAALAELSGRKADRTVVRSLTRAQDSLGEGQDLVTLVDWLTTQVAHTDGEIAAFAAGLLVGRARRDEQGSRDRWRTTRERLRELV